MTDIVLAHGLWLDGSTWDRVTPALTAAGHRTHALTLPGAAGEDPDTVGLEDQVDAVVAAIDAIDPDAGPVLLVGHSAACGVVHAAMDRRVGRVARVVHVGGFPPESGDRGGPDLPAEDGVVPMPDWREMGEEANIRDFDEAAERALYADAIPVPQRVLRDTFALTDEARHGVPMTLVCPEYSADDVREWAGAGHLPEVVAAEDVTYVDLGGGHWPQLTQPDRLAEVLLAAASG